MRIICVFLRRATARAASLIICGYDENAKHTFEHATAFTGHVPWCPAQHHSQPGDSSAAYVACYDWLTARVALGNAGAKGAASHHAGPGAHQAVASTGELAQAISRRAGALYDQR